MEFITLNNGLQMPQLGFGVWQVPDEEATAAVAKALEVGYTSIDTAMIYGNEASVGRGIRESDVPRREVFVTTKLWNDDIRQGRTREAFLRSLDALGRGCAQSGKPFSELTDGSSSIWIHMRAPHRTSGTMDRCGRRTPRTSAE